jgi:hypothetical protein
MNRGMSLTSFTYEPVWRNGCWMVEATDRKGRTHLLTCGISPSREEWIRLLLLDDDKYDVADGLPRRYQS